MSPAEAQAELIPKDARARALIESRFGTPQENVLSWVHALPERVEVNVARPDVVPYNELNLKTGISTIGLPSNEKLLKQGIGITLLQALGHEAAHTLLRKKEVKNALRPSYWVNELAADKLAGVPSGFRAESERGRGVIRPLITTMQDMLDVQELVDTVIRGLNVNKGNPGKPR